MYWASAYCQGILSALRVCNTVNHVIPTRRWVFILVRLVKLASLEGFYCLSLLCFDSFGHFPAPYRSHSEPICLNLQNLESVTVGHMRRMTFYSSSIGQARLPRWISLADRLLEPQFQALSSALSNSYRLKFLRAAASRRCNYGSHASYDFFWEVNTIRATTYRFKYSFECWGLVNRCKEALPALIQEKRPHIHPVGGFLSKNRHLAI